MAGRMRGGGGWLCGVRFWRGLVCRGGGWRRRLGGAEGGAGRNRGGGWVKGGGVLVVPELAPEDGEGARDWDRGEEVSIFICKGMGKSGKTNSQVN